MELIRKITRETRPFVVGGDNPSCELRPRFTAGGRQITNDVEWYIDSIVDLLTKESWFAVQSAWQDDWEHGRGWERGRFVCQLDVEVVRMAPPFMRVRGTLEVLKRGGGHGE